MIYSELPKSGRSTYRKTKKKYISIITPDKFLVSEKLVLGIMFTGVALILITIKFKKG